MSYMSLEDPHRPPKGRQVDTTKIYAGTSFEAGYKKGLKTMEQEVAELKEKLARRTELLGRASNLWLFGQKFADIETKLPVKEACEADALRIIAEINEVLLER